MIYHHPEDEAKLQADKSCEEPGNQPQTEARVDQYETVGIYGQRETRAPRPYTLHYEASESEHYHREVAKKHSAAASFFLAHPEFDEFIRLVRSGAIRF